MTTTTCPGPHGQPPVTFTVTPDILSQIGILDNAFLALYETFAGGAPSEVIVYTPFGLNAPSATSQAHPATFDPNALYVENFAGTEDSTYYLQTKADVAIVSGTADVHLIGRSGANEILTGNLGNDTIRGHGGTGTILAGNGSNHIHSGHGNMYIQTGTGNDTIHTGMGSDTVVTHGAATVFAGSGNDVYYDEGTSGTVFVGTGNATLYAGSNTDHFIGGSGFTLMNSGAGNDTFTGGSGFTVMNGGGTGNTTFDFNSTYHGTSLVEGFNTSTGAISLEGYTVSQFMADTTVVGGNSFVNLGDGTKIVFLGVDITKASFH